MALTSGAKKFLGLIATVAVVGGGIYGYKQHQASQPVEQAAIVAPAPQVELKVNAPAPGPVVVPAPQVVEQAQPEPAPAPVQVQHADPSANRGMAALLNAGKSK